MVERWRSRTSLKLSRKSSERLLAIRRPLPSCRRRAVSNQGRQKLNSVPVAGLTSGGPQTDTIGDVLVVGGGISGIQASLDLAGTGFRVYLVDKSPAIGGK
ncbi:MAG TPA: FAD-dependent oxidoreductase, partial [Geobacteraceae bacterium]|nr:FAD-dependent oxidoreductase [Geobacteraceae bacterium]